MTNEKFTKSKWNRRNTYSANLVVIIFTDAGHFGVSNDGQGLWVEIPEWAHRFYSIDELRELYAVKRDEIAESRAVSLELTRELVESGQATQARVDEVLASRESEWQNELLLIEIAASALSDGTLEAIAEDVAQADENTREKPQRAQVKCSGRGQCGKCSGTGEYVGWIENGRKRSNTGFVCWACNGTGCRSTRCSHK